MTPLMQDIEELRQILNAIRKGSSCDNLNSFDHVRIQWIFRRVYFDGELMNQLQNSQAIARGERLEA